MQAYLSLILKSLTDGLKSVGAENIVKRVGSGYMLNKNEVYCDAYEYANGNPLAINKFYGEYMSQYSWAEESVGKFYK